jgi:diguanylate cyclase (GGDEF)-like protein
MPPSSSRPGEPGPSGDGFPDDVAARLLSYMERTTDLVGVADDRGNITYLNDAARSRLGIPYDEERAVTTADLFPEAAFDIYFEQIRPRVLRGGVWSGYLPVRGGSGEPLEMWVTVVGEALPGGEVAWLALTARDVTEWRHVREDFGRRATRDDLTGLPTRALLMDHLDKALARARRTGDSVAVMFVDLNDLKAVNDSYGHQAGDAVLGEVARRLRDSVRAIDTVARVGGDEFVVLFDGVDSEEEAFALATRVHAILESTAIDTGGSIVNVSASAGVAVGMGNESGTHLLARADTAMYDVKGERRLPPVWPQRGGVHQHHRPVTAHDVAVAVTQRAIAPWYQPVVEASTGTVVGYQALARWLRSEGEAIPASEFLGAVEGSGVGFSLDLAILRHAATDFATMGDPDSTLYIHVSSRFLTRPGVERFVREVLARAELDPSRLALVVPDRLVGKPALVGGVLEALTDLGSRLVVDLPVGASLPSSEAGNHTYTEVRLGLGWPDAERDTLARTTDVAHERGLAVHAIGVDTAPQ